MTRPSQLLHPQRTPSSPLQAATLLLLRDAPDGPGFEVLMTRRSDRASFLPGAYVFPGGGIEAQDAAAHGLAWRRASQDDAQLTAAIAALRESFEELGLLLARHEDGRPADASTLAALDRNAPLGPQLQQHRLQLAADGLHYLCHWTADRNLPKRFAVPFFVARMPADQQPVADEREQFEPVWVRPADAVARHAAGSLPIIFPTLRTLQRLARFASAQAVFDALADGGPLWVSAPRSGLLHAEQHRCMEDDAPYGELELVCPDGQILHPLHWQHETAVPLRKNLLRLTAPNASVMTGPGTNSYLVGDADTGYLAIDPGPADAAHIQRLHDAAGGDIRAIVCTHSHADHAPGAFVLQQLVARSRGAAHTPLIYGLPSAPTANAASQFVPDVVLQDGERLQVSANVAGGGALTHTLQAVFTPGHAANHVCFWLVEDGLLFSGDHILNGATPIINPPDGSMVAYLDALERLDALCADQGLEFILPAHGHALARPRQVIAQLRAHRLQREAKVLAAVRALPQGSVQDWVAHAYADTPPSRWKLAERSLLAHMERLRALGQVAG